MPYRIDLPDPAADALDILIELGALDVEQIADTLAAIMPDPVSASAVAAALGTNEVAVSPAIARDEGSTWVVRPRPVRLGRFLIASTGEATEPGALVLSDSPVFGSGLHPTTALCLELLGDVLDADVPKSVLDIGTGSGVLALASLKGGVPRAVGIDIDDTALRVAAENARGNQLAARMRLVCGGPEAVRGSWPLVLANIMAAPLIEMAPALVRRVGHGGSIMLSGIAWSVGADVERAYRRLGMRLMRSETRVGWTCLLLQATW